MNIKNKIKIKVNGRKVLFDNKESVGSLIKKLNIPLNKVAIELNKKILDKKKIGVKLDFFQSNLEGEIVTKIQNARKEYDGIIINAAGYTHTSVSIRDALDIFKKPIIELHISNIYKREEFRQKSLISGIVNGIICGLGSNGYILAINAMHELLKNGNR